MKKSKQLQIDIAFIFIEFFNEYFISKDFSKKIQKKTTIRADKYAKKVIELLKKYETRQKSI